MIKIVSIFLILMVVLAMFGRLRMPKIKNPLKRKKVQPGEKCDACGRYNLAGETCICAAPK